jgi:hypothetical protein
MLLPSPHTAVATTGSFPAISLSVRTSFTTSSSPSIVGAKRRGFSAVMVVSVMWIPSWVSVDCVYYSERTITVSL